MMWRWLVLVLVFGLGWSRWALAADGEITLDLTTLAAVGTGLGTLAASVAGAAWRYWPRTPTPTPTPSYSPPADAVATSPKVPTKTAIIREVKAEELQRRITELLPMLERVDWETLDSLGHRLDQLEALIEKRHGGDD